MIEHVLIYTAFGVLCIAIGAFLGPTIRAALAAETQRIVADLKAAYEATIADLHKALASMEARALTAESDLAALKRFLPTLPAPTGAAPTLAPGAGGSGGTAQPPGPVTA